VGWIGSLLDRVLGAPDEAPIVLVSPETPAVAGRGPYREAAGRPVTTGPLVLERLPRFAGWQVLATLDGDGERYARFQLAPPSPSGPEHALACFAVEPLADEGWFAIAFDEARIYTRLAHPNIGPVIAMEAEGPIWWHLCEHPRGETVEGILARVRYGAPRPSIDLIAAAFADFAAGLDAAHAHRDEDNRLLGFRYAELRPSSLLLGLDGVGRVVDWGLSSLVRLHENADADERTRVRSLDERLRDRLHYLSPEEVLGKAADGRADVFTLGTMLYELCTSTSAFLGENDLATIQLVRGYELPRLAEVVPGCPSEVDALVWRALVKDPAARCSARELAEGLRRGLGERGVDPVAVITGYVRSLSEVKEGDPR
jgi:serine/threonine-protein kinase